MKRVAQVDVVMLDRIDDLPAEGKIISTLRRLLIFLSLFISLNFILSMDGEKKGPQKTNISFARRERNEKSTPFEDLPITNYGKGENISQGQIAIG